MANGRDSITFKVPKYVIEWMDKNIECGRYSDRTDCILQALWYQMNKEELRSGLLSDMSQNFDELLLSRLYAEENQAFLYKICSEVALKIFNERGLKKDK